MHERLINQIVEFEKDLDNEHEVGGRFVQGPGAEPLHIENVASWGPDMIIFVGKYSDGRKFEIIQHYSQVNLFLDEIEVIEQPLGRWSQAAVAPNVETLPVEGSENLLIVGQPGDELVRSVAGHHRVRGCENGCMSRQLFNAEQLSPQRRICGVWTWPLRPRHPTRKAGQQGEHGG
jgi:hypothetical protein